MNAHCSALIKMPLLSVEMKLHQYEQQQQQQQQKKINALRNLNIIKHYPSTIYFKRVTNFTNAVH